MAHHNPKVKLEKAPVVEPVKWDPDDHPHAIWCSSYGPDEAMQSTNSLSYIDPETPGSEILLHFRTPLL